MKSNLKRLGSILMLAALFGSLLVMGSDAAPNRKKQKYLKNSPPLGWQYQAGYTLWRLERGLDATPQTWRKYVREKKRIQRRGQENVADKLILNSLDWTIEELAALLDEQKELLKFHPAGVEPQP
ncbi:MAG: hypothetical protein Q4A13_08270 [Fretibacterium sp.]|nr:hypothetical protein [Fretibacterium sp.]